MIVGILHFQLSTLQDSVITTDRLRWPRIYSGFIKDLYQKGRRLAVICLGFAVYKLYRYNLLDVIAASAHKITWFVCTLIERVRIDSICSEHRDGIISLSIVRQVNNNWKYGEKLTIIIGTYYIIIWCKKLAGHWYNRHTQRIPDDGVEMIEYIIICTILFTSINSMSVARCWHLPSTVYVSASAGHGRWFEKSIGSPSPPPLPGRIIRHNPGDGGNGDFWIHRNNKTRVK